MTEDKYFRKGIRHVQAQFEGFPGTKTGFRYQNVFLKYSPYADG